MNNDGLRGAHTAGEHWQSHGQLTELNAHPDSELVLPVVPWDPERHSDMVQEWVGFMYRTDAPIAILEGLAANPEQSAEVRDVALDRLLGALFDMVRADGVKVVWVWTRYPAVVE